MSALEGLSAKEKAELVCSLSALLCADAKVELSADNINAVIAASGNAVSPFWATAFASTLAKAGGVDKFLAGPGEGESESINRYTMPTDEHAQKLYEF
jgi:hypothetical protein